MDQEMSLSNGNQQETGQHENTKKNVDTDEMQPHTSRTTEKNTLPNSTDNDSTDVHLPKVDNILPDSTTNSSTNENQTNTTVPLIIIKSKTTASYTDNCHCYGRQKSSDSC